MRTEVSLGRYVLKRELHSRYCCDGLHQFALRNAMHTFFFLGKADQSLICEHPLFFFHLLSQLDRVEQVDVVSIAFEKPTF